MVMNCVNLHSMKPAKWLSSPRWMGHRTGKVRTQSWERREAEGRGGGGAEEGRRKDQPLPLEPAVNPSPRHAEGAQQRARSGRLRGNPYPIPLQTPSPPLFPTASC